MKVVINRSFGGFSLSEKACEILNCDRYDYCAYNRRTSHELIAVIESIGTDNASGDFADLKIVEIPNDVEYDIENYDGMEKVVEVHREWF